MQWPNKHDTTSSHHLDQATNEVANMAALGEDLLGVVNKLQDLVFNTIGNDSLDLPQIVCSPELLQKNAHP